MATKNKKNDTSAMELVGQVMRVKKSNGSCNIADLYKSKTINTKTKIEVPSYSIMSNTVFHIATGATIGEVIADFMWQCDDTGCQPFIEPKIFNAHLAELQQQETHNQKTQQL